MAGADAAALSRKPLVLQTNKIPYVIAGGSLLPRFLGEEAGPGPDHPPSQMWVASTVSSALGSETEGLSRIAPSDGGLHLKSLLDSFPELFLGVEHVGTWGSSPGFLIKLLNSRDRLLVQVHPDKERARRYFGSGFGKTEAWYVVAAEPGALVHAGFRPGVTKEILRAAIVAEDSARILDLLHAFAVAAGDILFIPAGLPHALGKDSLVVEIQEPTDITLRAERRRPTGELLPETFLHAGRGMDVLLECFDYECPDFATARRRIFLDSAQLRSGGGCTEMSLVSRATTDCFAMNSVELEAGAGCARLNRGFAVALVISGEGLIKTADGPGERIRQGSEVFIPHGVGEYSYEADGGMKLIECYPPAPKGEAGTAR
jgi:mannose-6-phosphate isomerase